DYFFFQAQDGIRDFHVTGVQTCALPICRLDVERAMGIEPTLAAWEAAVLPLNYARAWPQSKPMRRGRATRRRGPAPRRGASESGPDGREGGGLATALLALVQAHAEVGVEPEQPGARAAGPRGPPVAVAGARHRVVEPGGLRAGKRLGRAVLELAVEGQARVGRQVRADLVARLPAHATHQRVELLVGEGERGRGVGRILGEAVDLDLLRHQSQHR